MVLDVQLIVDQEGNKTAVVVDLKKNAELWEDFYDRALAEQRAAEPRESLALVKSKLRRGKRRSDG